MWEDMQGRAESWYIVWLVKCMEKACVKAGLLDPDTEIFMLMKIVCQCVFSTTVVLAAG